MFMPNTSCSIRRKSRQRDLYGRAGYGASQVVMCSVVKIESYDEKTPVRADSSASRGFAREAKAACVILFQPQVAPQKEDLIEFGGIKFEVTFSHVRLTASGEIHHQEVHGVAWAA